MPWENIKWMFQPDGGLRDIYIHEVSIEDWKNVINFINNNYEVAYGDLNHQIDNLKIGQAHALKYLSDHTGEIESIGASIRLGKILLNCYFFLEDEIEFDMCPSNINSLKDFKLLETFMSNLSQLTSNQVILTFESDPMLPLIKIDTCQKINIVLTHKDLKKILTKKNNFFDRLKSFTTALKLILFRKRVIEKLRQSACEPHTSTKKSDHIW